MATLVPSYSSNPRRLRWRSRTRFVLAPLVLLSGAFPLSHHTHASGWYGPPVYLKDAGKLLAGTPEFYWELELKRVARDYLPPEKRGPAPPPADDSELIGPANPVSNYGRLNTEIETREFAEAVKSGRLVPEHPARADAAMAAARLAVETGAETLPEEEASEFRDYHRGAFAFHRKDFDTARGAWLALLARPAAERHYRTVWATYMLGKVALVREDFAAAATLLQETRLRAREGFADALGLAAESYGWEALAELRQEHRVRAAELYLTQLALGDRSALDSLRVVMGDTERDQAKADELLRVAARQPLLRRLTTASFLSASGGSWTNPGNDSESGRHWLELLKAADLHETEGAEYLAWLAYTGGDYELAGRWLAMARAEAPAALWLKAKLQQRAGELEQAASSMLQAWKAIQGTASYTGWPEDGALPKNLEDLEHDTANLSIYRTDNDRFSFEQNAGGDYGMLQMTRGQFVPALDAFRRGGLWIDAAYVAEQVLTTNELRAYVDRQPPEPKPPKVSEEVGEVVRFRSLRHLLGRRLMREGRSTEAAKYLPAPYAAMARDYAKAMAEGYNAKLPKTVRARAYFKAAWLTRYSGMELMGTEGPPDGYVTRGDFEAEDLSPDAPPLDGEAKPPPRARTKEEDARVAKTQVQPAVRFHYRLLAAQLAMKAAALLPDQAPELADVINKAGRWTLKVGDREPDEYYAVLERRAARTPIGRVAMERHWFIEQDGPWSQRERAAHAGMMK